VGKYDKPSTGIGIPTHTRVCLEVNTHTGTLDYFINDKHVKERVVNVPKDVYSRSLQNIIFLHNFNTNTS
jgi:predicted membrane protein